MKIIGDEVENAVESQNKQNVQNRAENLREKFCEKNAKNGRLGMILGRDLLEKVGFDK